MTTVDIELPEAVGSRIHRPPKSESPDDFTTAAERIAAFWETWPNGSILPEVESRQVVTDGVLPHCVYTVRVYVRKDAASERPDAVAHATRSEADPDPVTAQFAQEVAETSAISRAIRNLGILPNGTKAAATPAVAAPASATNSLALARETAGLSQKKLAEAMREAGVRWSQAVVSKVEHGHRQLSADEIVVLARLIGYKASP